MIQFYAGLSRDGERWLDKDNEVYRLNEARATVAAAEDGWSYRIVKETITRSYPEAP